MTDAVDPYCFPRLIQRCGRAHVERRLAAENRRRHHWLYLRGLGVYLEDLVTVGHCLEAGLRLTHLWGRGRRNFRAVQVRHERIRLPRLAAVFNGFRLLQLSDLHLDIDPGLAPVVASLVAGLRYDVAVITGDIQGDRLLSPGALRPLLGPLRAALGKPTYAVLGNHDYLAGAEEYEAVGWHLLLNEHICWDREGESLCLGGVDDPHFYRLDDVRKAFAGSPPEATRVLLAHSPECHHRAEAAGVDLMLCGHTHGGQFCLPGGIPVITNMEAPRRLAAGRWRSGRMVGYTSRGTGGSGVAVRFWCRPEVVVHELTCP